MMRALSCFTVKRHLFAKADSNGQRHTHPSPTRAKVYGFAPAVEGEIWSPFRELVLLVTKIIRFKIN
jgi:hypothetical protein